MKDFLFCPIMNCGFHIGYEVDADFETIGEIIDEFKKHLREHTSQELSNSLFSYMTMIRELIEHEEEKFLETKKG